MFESLNLLAAAVINKPGIWDNTIHSLKDNTVSLAVLLVLSGAYFAARITRRRKPVDDIER
ncbi:MAG: hypothetical protein LBB94_13175 [Clostridiales bacterium]|jgi:hypothetical protein|nr:hypothetical protein [Clostridiales bacterium]